MNNSKQKVNEICKENDWNFSNFEKYYELITEKNKVMNLTGFKGEVLWNEGILESLIYMLQVLEKFPKSDEKIKILDIGSGAGFPSIPLALTSKNVNITIYEPIEKRVKFLKEVVNEFKLEHKVTVINTRSEDVKEKNLFDLVVARAVADINSMLLSSFHLVKIKGIMSLIKGSKVDWEIKEATQTLKILKTEAIKEKLLNDNSEKENWIVNILKIRSTPPQFPFKWKDIVKNKNNSGLEKK